MKKVVMSHAFPLFYYQNFNKEIAFCGEYVLLRELLF